MISQIPKQVGLQTVNKFVLDMMDNNRRNYPWFQIVKDYAEVRLPGAKVILDGFGPKLGKQCGNLPPREYESIVAIFRQGQKGFCSNWLDP